MEKGYTNEKHAIKKKFNSPIFSLFDFSDCILRPFKIVDFDQLPGHGQNEVGARIQEASIRVLGSIQSLQILLSIFSSWTYTAVCFRPSCSLEFKLLECTGHFLHYVWTGIDRQISHKTAKQLYALKTNKEQNKLIANLKSRI